MFGPLDAAQRQVRSLEQLDHRPWPLPKRGWAMGQTWEDLLFAHWHVPLPELRAHVPKGLEVDTFDGEAWLGVVPAILFGGIGAVAVTVLWMRMFPELTRIDKLIGDP